MYTYTHGHCVLNSTVTGAKNVIVFYYIHAILYTLFKRKYCLHVVVFGLFVIHNSHLKLHAKMSCIHK